MNAPLSWGRLLKVQCGELDGAADGWGRISNRADAARDRLVGQMKGGLQETQRGEAVDAALARMKRLARNFQYVYTETGLVRSLLNSLAHEVRTQQHAVRSALDEAAALKFTVHADGSVTYPSGGEALADGRPLRGGTAWGDGYPGITTPMHGLVAANPNQTAAQDIADRIARALRTAAETDWEFGRILRDLRAEAGLAVPDSVWTDTAADASAVRIAADAYLRDNIPFDGTPAERKGWWNGLSQERREEYLAVYPDVIGNLDGIPALVRDTANRDNLQLLIGKLEGRDDDTSRTQLAALQEIERQLLAVPKPGDPPMYLLGIGDQGNGRAIVSYGNPDASKNVAAYVPGLNTALDEGFARDDLKRARDTAINARDIDPSTASIAWLGYDAPQLVDGWSSLAVTGTGRAEKGGTAFYGFMEGIAATNEHDDPHLTAIGHSYGSRTVGAATQEEDGIPGVDDIVLVGSPGVGVDRAEDLRVGRDHVFVGAAENDIVTKMPTGVEAASLSGLLQGSPAGAIVDPAGDDIWFGKDPASQAFGARRFQVGDGPTFPSLKAHSNYFDLQADPVSVGNISFIITNKSDQIQREVYR
ncbi:alpha/beta hydrolase [uncultured Streptomyces sp.]|uniref:alpha/beta hydrolase n=1 Tax=uncultured Streptomyces sp. TaxID=174707 RepID=UPI00262B8868|nr:alpha/beta hydrolase [uncultured Streptomyces sp.]